MVKKMAKKNNEFIELAKAKMVGQRNIVISARTIDKSFTIAQQVTVLEGHSQISVFLKGAIHIEDLHSLYNMRDALNEAIHKYDDLADPKPDPN